MLAVGTAAVTSVFLIRDTYYHVRDSSEKAAHQQQHQQYSTGTTKSKKSDKIHPSTATSSSSSHHRRSSSSSPTDVRAGEDTLSLLEERGIAIARFRSARILVLLALVLFCILIATDAFSAASGLVGAFNSAPSLSSTAGIATLCRNVTKVSEQNSSGTVALLLSLYLLLQTFCIPGTIALNAVLGALLGTGIGVPCCVLAGAIGACCCYTLSSAVGTGFASWVDSKLLGSKGVPKLRAQVNKNRSELLGYLLFLRLTPVLPNWLINLASPVLGVPLPTFALATLVGIAPQTYLSVRFGSAARSLSELSGGDGGAAAGAEGQKIVTIWDTVLIALLGVMIIVVSRLKSKFGAKDNAVATD